MTLLKSAFSLLIFTLTLSSAAQGEILRWPQICPVGKLLVQNSSNQTFRAWIQKFSGEKRIETELTLPAHRLVSINIQSAQASERFTLMHFADPTKISAVFECENPAVQRVAANSVEGGVMRFSKSDLAENKLWLQNLYSDSNLLRIDYFSDSDQVVFSESVVLGSLQQKNHKPVRTNLAFYYLRISAAHRMSAFNLTSQGAVGPNAVKPQKVDLEMSAGYFLVSPREGPGDSFIVQIKDPEMILRARELVAHPEMEKMVFAKIEKGHHAFNRNWSKKEKSFWSWAPTEVTNFADYGSTSCNGIPQLVEDDVNQWTKDPGRICFWNYRIKKELTSAEMAAP